MIICSKCGKECGAKSESRSANSIYSDSVAVSSCCGADRIYDEGYSVDEDGLQECRHYGIETSSTLGECQDSKFGEPHQYPTSRNITIGYPRTGIKGDQFTNHRHYNRENDFNIGEGWINIEVHNLPSDILEDGKEFMVYNALYSQWEETDEDICDLLKQLRSKRILLKYRDKL